MSVSQAFCLLFILWLCVANVWHERCFCSHSEMKWAALDQTLFFCSSSMVFTTLCSFTFLLFFCFLSGCSYCLIRSSSWQRWLLWSHWSLCPSHLIIVSVMHTLLIFFLATFLNISFLSCFCLPMSLLSPRVSYFSLLHFYCALPSPVLPLHCLPDKAFVLRCCQLCQGRGWSLSLHLSSSKLHYETP